MFLCFCKTNVKIYFALCAFAFVSSFLRLELISLSFDEDRSRPLISLNWWFWLIWFCVSSPFSFVFYFLRNFSFVRERGDEGQVMRGSKPAGQRRQHSLAQDYKIHEFNSKEYFSIKTRFQHPSAYSFEVLFILQLKSQLKFYCYSVFSNKNLNLTFFTNIFLSHTQLKP